MRKRPAGGMVSDSTEFAEKGEVRPDAKKRVLLKGKVYSHYRVYENSAGQILLDPMVMVPAREAWLFKNKQALGAVNAGLAEAAEGKLVRLKSLAKHAEEPLDE